MDQQMGVMLGFAGLILFIVLIAWWAANARKKIANAYADFAKNHNLEHEPGSRHVHGEIGGGRTFAMFQDVSRGVGGYKRRNQHQQVPHFVVRVDLASDAPEKLEIGKKGMLAGSSSIQTGDPDFDKKAYVSCPDEDAAKTWLSSAERRAAIIEAVTRLKAGIIGPRPGDQMHDGHPLERPILYRRFEGGYKAKLPWFEERFREYTDLAQRIDETG